MLLDTAQSYKGSRRADLDSRKNAFRKIKMFFCTRTVKEPMAYEMWMSRSKGRAAISTELIKNMLVQRCDLGQAQIVSGICQSYLDQGRRNRPGCSSVRERARETESVFVICLIKAQADVITTATMGTKGHKILVLTDTDQTLFCWRSVLAVLLSNSARRS